MKDMQVRTEVGTRRASSTSAGPRGQVARGTALTEVDSAAGLITSADPRSRRLAAAAPAETADSRSRSPLTAAFGMAVLCLLGLSACELLDGGGADGGSKGGRGSGRDASLADSAREGDGAGNGASPGGLAGSGSQGNGAGGEGEEGGGGENTGAAGRGGATGAAGQAGRGGGTGSGSGRASGGSGGSDQAGSAGTPGRPGGTGGKGAGSGTGGASGAAGQGSGSPGEGGSPDSSGAGGAGGTAGGGQDAGAGAPGAADSRQLSPAERRAQAWVGRWSGSLNFQVFEDDPTAVEPGTQILVQKNLPVELRIEHYREDGETGWASLEGRMALGHCLVSTQVSGQVFRGDELTQVPAPRVSLTAGGESQRGLMVSARLAGEQKVAGLIEGALSFASYDGTPPCAGDNLKFRVEAVESVVSQ
jgi:hypothetical protein